MQPSVRGKFQLCLLAVVVYTPRGARHCPWRLPHLRQYLGSGGREGGGDARLPDLFGAEMANVDVDEVNLNLKLRDVSPGDLERVGVDVKTNHVPRAQDRCPDGQHACPHDGCHCSEKEGMVAVWVLGEEDEGGRPVPHPRSATDMPSMSPKRACASYSTQAARWGVVGYCSR